jgi:hypothetical protein
LGGLVLREQKAGFGCLDGELVAGLAVFGGLQLVGVEGIFAFLRFEPILFAELQGAQA